MFIYTFLFMPPARISAGYILEAAVPIDLPLADPLGMMI